MLFAVGSSDVLVAVAPIPHHLVRSIDSAPIEECKGVFLIKSPRLLTPAERTLARHTVLLGGHKVSRGLLGKRKNGGDIFKPVHNIHSEVALHLFALVRTLEEYRSRVFFGDDFHLRLADRVIEHVGFVTLWRQHIFPAAEEKRSAFENSSRVDFAFFMRIVQVRNGRLRITADGYVCKTDLHHKLAV